MWALAGRMQKTMIEEDQVADDNGISKNDIPGASLSGRDPSTLTSVYLRPGTNWKPLLK